MIGGKDVLQLRSTIAMSNFFWTVFINESERVVIDVSGEK